MYNYIPHPSNCRQVGGVLSLRIEEGAAGYGVYWMILEMLRDAPNYRLQNNVKAIAFAINEGDIDLVRRVTSDTLLFDVDDDGLLYSPWLLQQMGAYDERKRKLQEAGRKGAAARFHSSKSEDSKAIATPKPANSDPIAYNTTQLDMTEHDITSTSDTGVRNWRSICANPGDSIDPGLLDALCKTSPEGHAPGYIAQVCIRYGMGSNVLDFLCEATEGAKVTNATYLKFCAIVKRVEGQKWRPEHPANFFLSKLF